MHRRPSRLIHHPARADPRDVGQRVDLAVLTAVKAAEGNVQRDGVRGARPCDRGGGALVDVGGGYADVAYCDGSVGQRWGSL